MNLLPERLIWKLWLTIVVTKQSAPVSASFKSYNLLFDFSNNLVQKPGPLRKKVNWIILIIAGLFEVAFTFCLGKARESSGGIMYGWYFGFLVSLFMSMILLIKATQSLPLGTAYAVWTGIGAVGTALVGILVFKEPASFLRIFFITSLIGSIIGLKAVS